MIQARELIIPESATIEKNVSINCDVFIIGENCYIGKGVKINCKSFICGDYLYMADNVEVGRGGSYGVNSNITIGNNVGIFESTIINPSESVTIGDNCGIGSEVMIWTHGAWLDIFDGFPSSFGPVIIQENVWLPAKSIVLPNVIIGKNTVITINSVINRNIPSGSLAGGNPAKVIKNQIYPKIIKDEDKVLILNQIVSDWEKLLISKNHENYTISITSSNHVKLIEDKNIENIFDFSTKPYKIIGPRSILSEDLRDYFRRRGLKIYNGLKFSSIDSNYIQR